MTASLLRPVASLANLNAMATEKFSDQCKCTKLRTAKGNKAIVGLETSLNCPSDAHLTVVTPEIPSCG